MDSAYVAYLQDLAARDIAVLFGRTRASDERTFGLVVFRAETEACGAGHVWRPIRPSPGA